VAWHYFNVSEATALLPRLRELLDALRRFRDQAALKKTRLEMLWQRLGRGESVLARISDEQRELDRVTARLIAAARDLEGTGCILRDVDRGLVDFACRAHGGRTVFLCWHLGEAAIEFWHGVDEGYAGRKPLAELPLDDV